MIDIFASFFALDLRLGAVPALRASYELVRANPGTVALAALIAGITAAAGVVALVIGTLVTVPLATLLTAYTYRKLKVAGASLAQ